jgi:hypothetical protein
MSSEGAFSRTGEAHALAGLQKVEIASDLSHCRGIKAKRFNDACDV